MYTATIIYGFCDQRSDRFYVPPEHLGPNIKMYASQIIEDGKSYRLLYGFQVEAHLFEGSCAFEYMMNEQYIQQQLIELDELIEKLKHLNPDEEYESTLRPAIECDNLTSELIPYEMDT
jgi:hypothetical protein